MAGLQPVERKVINCAYFAKDGMRPTDDDSAYKKCETQIFWYNMKGQEYNAGKINKEQIPEEYTVNTDEYKQYQTTRTECKKLYDEKKSRDTKKDSYDITCTEQTQSTDNPFSTSTFKVTPEELSEM